MTPTDRKASILDAAVIAAEKVGFTSVRQADIAKQADCAYGLITTYFKTMTQMRRAIMRAAVARGNLKLIAQGIANNHPAVSNLHPELRNKAIQSLMS